MGTQIVELTGDEARLLKSLDNVIKKQLDYERKLRDTTAQGDAAGVALGDALRKVSAESDKALNGLLRELKTLGPEGASAAAALRAHLVDAGKAGHRSMDEVIAQLRLIDTAAAEAAAGATAAFTNSAQQTQAAWREQLDLLRSLGPAGADAAARIEADIKSAAANAAGGMDVILDRIQALDPAAASTAARIRTELAEAAQFSEREFAGVLDQLRRLSPEGRQVAAELRRHLVDAGKISERSIADIARELETIDPAAAKAARSIIANMETAGKKTDAVIANSITKVGAYAASFASVTTAVEAVRKLWSQVVMEQNIALDALKAPETADRRLLQVSGSAEEFAKLRQLSESLAIENGIDLVTVKQAVFQAKSEGFLKEIPELLAANQVVEVRAQAIVAGQIPKLFSEEQLTPQEAVSANLVASQKSRIDFEQLASVAPAAAEGGKVLGSSFAETQATLAVLASAFKSPETAADRIKAFAVKASLDPELSKLRDLTDVVKNLRDGSAERRVKFLGESAELNTAFTALEQNLPQIEATEAEIIADIKATRAGGGTLRNLTQIANNDTRFAALRNERKAQSRLEITQVDFKGEEAAVASSAAADATATLLKEEQGAKGLFTRTLDAYLPTARVSAAVGFDRQQSALIATETARSISTLVTGLLGRNPFSTPQQLFVQARDRLQQINAAPAPEVQSRRSSDALIKQLIELQTNTLASIEEIAANTAPNPAPAAPLTPALSAATP